jgi:hypothetical protein
MALALHPLDLATLDALTVDSYVFFVGDDERPLSGLGGLLDWRLAAGLSRLLLDGRLVGAANESLLTPTLGALPGARIFAFGLGSLSRCTADVFAQAAQRAAAALTKAQATSIAIGLPEQPSLPVAAKALAQAFQPHRAIDVHLLGPVAELERALRA